jgi:hypothetical protein
MRFVNFAEQVIQPVDKEFARDILSGRPKQRVWSHFVGAGGRFKAGMWESTAGQFVGPMTNQIEFCHILEGEAQIETSDGQSRTVRAGDAFVMDNGLTPVWHVETYVRKHYVILSLEVDAACCCGGPEKKALHGGFVACRRNEY